MARQPSLRRRHRKFAGRIVALPVVLIIAPFARRVASCNLCVILITTMAPVHAADEDEPEFKPLTFDEARRLREKNPPVSPWRVIAAQIAVGLSTAAIAWLVTGKANVGWSSAYGAAAVALPTALFARGLMSRVASANAGAAVAGFFLWEMIKIGLTVAMLVAAPKLVQNLSWPAMLAGLVATMKVYWLVVLFKKHFQAGAKNRVS